jgi:hypothetical protein
MSKRRIAAALAAFTTSLMFVAAAAAEEFKTYQWAGNGYHLNSGQNGFLNRKLFLNEAIGIGENRAVCAGIREVGDSCVGRGEYAFYHHSTVYSEPYLHNHDAEAGYFYGWYTGEK